MTSAGQRRAARLRQGLPGRQQREEVPRQQGQTAEGGVQVPPPTQSHPHYRIPMLPHQAGR